VLLKIALQTFILYFINFFMLIVSWVFICGDCFFDLSSLQSSGGCFWICIKCDVTTTLHLERWASYSQPN